MLLRTITLSNSGNVCLDGGGYILALGYECTRGIYQLQLRPTGEWEGLTIRACWHLPDGTSTTTLAVDGYVDVPAAVTALPGTGCITFEGAAEGKTITSSDLRYLVGDNSGVEDGTLPEPNTPAWEQLVGAVHTDATAAEQAKTDAQTAAQQAGAAAQKAGQALSDTVNAKEDALAAIGTAQTAATQAVDAARDKALNQVEASTEAAQTAASQAADSATKAEQAAQRAEDAAAATNAIIDDTAIADSKTWSSKGIVDFLCPPIQATGNPVVCYPVADYPLGVTASWEPTQEGSGEPSPDNIRPIKGRDSVTVEWCGKNLLNPKKNSYNTYTPYGLTITYLGDNLVHLEGTYQENNGSFVILDSNQNLLAGRGLKITGFTVEGTKQKYSLYGLRTKNETAIAMNAQFTKGDAIDMTVAVVVSGSTPPTEYTPYTGQATTLTLPAPCYGGELDVVTGEGQETWVLLTLDGTESWRCWGVDFQTPGITGFYDLSVIDYDAKQAASAICSHFGHSSDAWGGQSAGIGFASVSSSRYLILSVKNNLLADTSSTAAAIDSLKAYLATQYAAGTPIQIAYKVATPTPITATGAQPISALPGVNTLLTDGDALTVTGRADPTHEIQQLRAAVVALGGTI